MSKSKRENCHLCNAQIAKDELFYTIASGIMPHYHSAIVFHADCFVEVAGDEYAVPLARKALKNLRPLVKTKTQKIVDKWNKESCFCSCGCTEYEHNHADCNCGCGK